MNSKSTHLNRNNSGVSLVELLIVVLVMGFLATAAFGMLTATMATQLKFDNKCDSLISAKKAVERVGRVMRMGRTFVTGPVVPAIPGNPICSATRMVVQVPKFDDEGFPYRDTGTNNEALETHVFEIVADSDVNNAGESILQWTKYSGIAVPASTNPAKGMLNSNLGPQTLVTGIIGPAGPFAYINRLDPNNPQPTPTGTLSDVTGASITFEVLDHKNSAKINGQWKNPVVMAYKTEVFMRNNAHMSNQGQSVSLSP